MEFYSARVEESGRILIPARLRKKLGLGPGATVVIEEDGGSLRLQTRENALRAVQQFFAQFDDGKSWSRELIAERRSEARREKHG